MPMPVYPDLDIGGGWDPSLMKGIRIRAKFDPDSGPDPPHHGFPTTALDPFSNPYIVKNDFCKDSINNKMN